MTMGPGDELRIPVRLDTSGIADDLAVVDREVQRIQQRMVSAFNRGPLVRRGRAQRAMSIEDVGEQRGSWTPEVRALDRQLNARLQSIERAAARGETKPPLTAQQAARSGAAERLAQIQRQGQQKPIEITARARFFDDMRQGLMRGLPGVAANTATGGLPGGASSAARLIMGLLGENPVTGAALAGAGIVGGATVAIGQERAAFQAQQAALASALVGGPAFGDTRTNLGLGVMYAAQAYSASREQGQQVAQALAGAGIPRGALQGNEKNVLALTQAYGLPTNLATGAVAAMGTAGGMNPQQIANTIRDLVSVSNGANGSLQQLVSGVQALSTANNAAARDTYSLAAIQRAVGPTSGVNAGQLMQGVMGATGTNALQAAALLGMTPQQFMAAQASGKGGMAHIYDRIAGFVRTLPADATGTMVAEQLLSSTGLLNMQGLNATQQASLVARLRAAPPGQAYAVAQQIRKAPKPRQVSPVTLAARNVGPLDQFKIGFGNMVTYGLNDPTHEGGAALAARSGAVAMVGPVPTPPAFNTSGQPRSATVNHSLRVEVTVKDQRGNTLGHQVDHTRVVTGAPSTIRPPATPPTRRPSPLDTPQPPGAWSNTGNW